MEIFLLFDVFLLNLKKIRPTKKAPSRQAWSLLFLRPSATGDFHMRAAVTAQLIMSNERMTKQNLFTNTAFTPC